MFKSNFVKTTSSILAILCLIGIFSACSGKDPSIGSKSSYDYDLTSFVKLGTYKGIEIGPYDPIVVTEEEIQVEINNIIQYYSSTESILEGTLALGDTANIDYVGKLDGVEFPGGADQGYDLTLGSGAFIPGFEEGIVGHDVGESFTIQVKFPDDYGNADLAGKDTEFDITINSITIPVIPEYNDEFVAEYMEEYSTTAELEADIRIELAAEKESELKYTKDNDIWAAVIENSEIIKLPQIEVERCVDEIVEYHTSDALYYGYNNLEEYIIAAGMVMDEFNQYLLESAEATVREELVMYAIIKAENIEVTDDEYEPLLQEYVTGLGYASVEELETVYGKDVLIHSLLWDKLLAFLQENAIVAG